MQESSECQLVFASSRDLLQKVEEEKSSDVFATEQENSSDYLSIKEPESDHEQNWADVAKVVFTWQWHWTSDAVLWVFEAVYSVLLNILLVPVAILGLFFDKLRRLLRKVSVDVDTFFSCLVPFQTQLQETKDS